MSDPNPPADSEAHIRCRNLVWEASPDNRGAVPGRYCVSRVGAIHSMDCPVYQGCSCCLFDPREDDESPVVSGEERLDEIRGLLAPEFLRWSYWRMVDVLRGSEPPPETGEPEVAEKPPEAVAPATEPDVEVIVRHELPPPPEKGEALKEKYPGQRRSEDRRRSRKPADFEEEAAEEDDFTRGIFELPSLDPEPEKAIPPEGPSPEPPSSEEKSAGGERQKSKSGPCGSRRRSRRRRGRPDRKGSSGGKPSP